MAPTTRLDRLVWVRERREQAALVQLAGAEQRLQEARGELGRRAALAATDVRGWGDAALWELDDAAHRRAIQAVRAAERDVASAAEGRDTARRSWMSAHQDTQVASRVAERKRAELRADLERRERREADEVAVQRFTCRTA